jgi:beta-aspartyl-peptidase (threonine type)
MTVAKSIVLLTLLAACAQTAPPPADPIATVETLLNRSAAAWNRGDLGAFVSDYAAGPATTFVSSGRVQRGFDWIRDNYAPRFAAGADRDSLRFEAVDARTLGPDFILATARFVLSRGDSVTSSGPFTVVFSRQADGWKIVHDHTSRDP